jgi:hypothetical protein
VGQEFVKQREIRLVKCAQLASACPEQFVRAFEELFGCHRLPGRSTTGFHNRDDRPGGGRLFAKAKSQEVLTRILRGPSDVQGLQVLQAQEKLKTREQHGGVVFSFHWVCNVRFEPEHTVPREKTLAGCQLAKESRLPSARSFLGTDFRHIFRCDVLRCFPTICNRVLWGQTHLRLLTFGRLT